MHKRRIDFSLLTQFTLLSLLVTGAIALALAYVLRERVVENALDQVATTAAEQADRLIAPFLTSADFGGLTPERLSALDTQIRRGALGQHIVRVKIWNAQGVLIYSDDPQLVGKSFPVSDELAEALAGRQAMDVSALDKAENQSEASFSGQPLFEIYVPIRLGSSRVLGAYEIYHDLNLVQTRIDELSRLVYGSVGFGFVILYLSLYVLVRRASQELVRRSSENARLFEEEQARREELAALYDLSRNLSGSDQFAAILDAVVRRTVETISVSFASIALLEAR